MTTNATNTLYYFDDLKIYMYSRVPSKGVTGNKHATFVPVPTTKLEDHQAWRWQGKSWGLVYDLRGVDVYDKATGLKTDIGYIVEVLPDNVTFQAPTVPNPLWRPEQGGWVEDPSKKLERVIRELSQESNNKYNQLKLAGFKYTYDGTEYLFHCDDESLNILSYIVAEGEEEYNGFIRTLTNINVEMSYDDVVALYKATRAYLYGLWLDNIEYKDALVNANSLEEFELIESPFD